MLGFVASGEAAPSAATRDVRPNIVVVLCDDLGYGDVQANFPQGLIRTPHMDRLAREGVRFTDPCAVCE